MESSSKIVASSPKGKKGPNPPKATSTPENASESVKKAQTTEPNTAPEEIKESASKSASLEQKPAELPVNSLEVHEKPSEAHEKPLETPEEPVGTHKKPSKVPKKSTEVPKNPVEVPKKPVEAPEKPVDVSEKSRPTATHEEEHKSPDSTPDNSTLEKTEEAETKPKSFPIEDVRFDESKPDAEDAAKEVEFTIEYKTNFGEKIMVVGSSPELGAWSVKEAIELQWNEPNLWKGKARVSMFPLEFKYVFVSNDAVVWEGGVNRTITAETSKIVDTWQ